MISLTALQPWRAGPYSHLNAATDQFVRFQIQPLAWRYGISPEWGKVSMWSPAVTFGAPNNAVQPAPRVDEADAHAERWL